MELTLHAFFLPLIEGRFESAAIDRHNAIVAVSRTAPTARPVDNQTRD